MNGNWIQFVALAANTVFQIARAEREFPKGTGKDKQELVVASVSDQIIEMGLVQELGGAGMAELMNLVARLVNDVVALLNKLGIFRHGAA